jgi:hypothetical protein
VAEHRLRGAHVDRVDVGALLAVDLHRHEVLVQEGGGDGVLEGLVLHHVAPVAGRVADGEEDRPVLTSRPLERLVAPGVPVDGVVGVLEEVGARLLGETVGMWRRSSGEEKTLRHLVASDVIVGVGDDSSTLLGRAS